MQKQSSSLQKLILPFLVLIIIGILFFNYFVPSDELGDFSKLDPNSHASVEIIVKMVQEKGIQRTGDGSLFYVIDAKNREISVSAPSKLPPGMSSVNSLKLVGHLTSKSNFHAHGVELMN